MTSLFLFFEAFHFLRPFWLLLVPAVLTLWWMIRRAETRRDVPNDGIAPHLRAALILGAKDRRRSLPIDGVTLGVILCALGAAGPTWSRLPDPFAAQSAPVVVVLKVTDTMEEDDVAPSRLERGKQKIRDFLDLRAGARTALVAYAGTAHVVLPMTEDPSVMRPYLEGLSPDIMPQKGEVAADALALAQSVLADEADTGGVLIVTDGIDPADVDTLNATGSGVAVLSMLPEGVRDRGLDALSIPLVEVTPDGGDLRRLDGLLNAAYRRAALENTEQPWLDRAYWLAWPAALIVLLWFRRGWTMRWLVLATLAYGAAAPNPSRADGVVDWFLTPDQQGQIAFNRRNFVDASELFEDPLWRGYALYRSGQYEDSIEVLARLDTAQASFIQGMAQIKSRSYRDAVRSFQTTLTRDPDYPGAADNLKLAEQIVDYVEEAREQSDTGDDGIGADEVVFDNEANRGVDSQVEVPQDGGDAPLTTEQWMNTVDTQTSDFLRIRFALEAVQASASDAGQPQAQPDDIEPDTTAEEAAQ
ncbi:VWA domain-containing protein [Qingshengfaniella alkalisoli]|uniref:VWA domain-containing protein n=1 Tax=Qingshengfaniella alkalisoli TaxID=2599296 RepID=A0A5B8J4Z3_9RHOB|nr:VWA domain-containing protein [Qingshengfaniella alkalisoli]QDY69617.1 VWA domain-containing protein [Qingshengfaniella alkalisoli]